MQSDPIGDQLKHEHDAAFDRYKEAKEARNRVGDERTQVRNRNSPRIDNLKAQTEREARDMRAAFGAAEAAHNSRRPGATEYSAQGRAHKANLERMNAELKQLFAEMSAVRVRHQAAQKRCDDAYQAFQSARDALLRHGGQTKESKLQSDAAIADRAGVPAGYLNDVYVSQDPITGAYQIYFGGLGDPLGDGHGHYVMQANGKVTYKRDPFDPHGVQNVVGYRPPAKKAATKQQPRPGTRQADQQAARTREDSRRREEARLAQERLDQAKEEERRRLDAPRIAAEAAAAAQAAAQEIQDRAARLAAEAAERARLERAIQQAAAEAGKHTLASDYYADPTQPGIAGFQARQMHARVERILREQKAAEEEAARNGPVVTPPEPIRQAPVPADHGPATDHRRPPREPERRPKPTQPVRPTPPVAPPVQPPVQPTLPTPPTQPAKAGTGQKWESTADRIKREAMERAIRDELAELRGDMTRLHAGEYSAENERRYIELRKGLGKSGEFGLSQHGTIDGKDVTFALGWGTKKGHTLIADGHITDQEFLIEGRHNHYGPGDGPNDNAAKRRHYYTGEGA